MSEELVNYIKNITESATIGRSDCLEIGQLVRDQV